jgi:mannose-6-phosphate isomerase-like protein (cupin superfamily)
MKYKYLSGLVFLFLFLSFCSYTQVKSTDSNTDIEALIDRFYSSKTTKNNNGWFHYYIPRDMGDTLTVKMSCVFEGKQTHVPHVHNEDEAFYIIKGPVMFHINGVEKVLYEGDFIYTPSGSSHNIQRINEDTIKYLVIKREWVRNLEDPFKVGNPDYTFDDCLVRNENYSKPNFNEKTLLNKEFADGFHVTINKIQKNKTFSNQLNSNNQTAIYILEGKTKINFNNQEAIIGGNSTFYSPKGSTFNITNISDIPLLLLSITTE